MLNTRHHHLITLGLLVLSMGILLAAGLTGCGYPKHIDPPLFTYPSETLTRLSAESRAKDIGGMVFWVAPPTGSMEPLLKGGDYIVVATSTRAPYAKLSAGEVVTYRADWETKYPVTHRLVKKDGNGWVLSGDANSRSEGSWRVTETSYLGTVDGIYRVKP